MDVNRKVVFFMEKYLGREVFVYGVVWLYIGYVIGLVWNFYEENISEVRFR